MSSALSTPTVAGYRPRAPFLDELFELDGTPRPAAAALVRELERLGPDGLLEAGQRRDAVFMQQGITFETGGEGGGYDPAHPGKERPFPLDLVPRVLSGEEWREIKRGLAQRIRALNHFVDDVYHAREIVREGLVPWRLVAGCPHFARAVHGIRPPGGVYTHVAGCDLVRHSDGAWKVIEDNVRIPSGISYVLENRAAMAQLVPELFASYRVRPVDHYPQLLLSALRSVAPSAESEATVVVWTPGPANPAYFEHAFLARQMGVELVEASDLVVRDDVLYMRTTRGLERVHAVYRRLDDDFVDPLEFRPDSLLGVPGPGAGLPRRQRGDRQRVRHRGRGRQGDLLLRPGDDPLLPGGGADPRERAHLPAVGPGSAGARARAHRAARGEADRRVGRPRAC